ncbi:slr1659 superfamily regulator [Leptospira sp. GIMC2001]|uniref:slr1659 superfamily regulator n=1 Tax=Leptospira sp. GIMC2001 TaxID=1513297 RepID=UPI00234C036F|nr:hypothetical protein [Leptospira sp. GIMC2001]WCL50316.1 hypothetical protein O4O04_05715 [Leptospira sp. GIMC2001]
MEVKTDEYAASFIEAENTVLMTGSMRLQNLAAYEEIKKILKDGLDRSQGQLTIDIRGLNFLNSSGITTISLFIIEARNKKTTPMRILGSAKISWQAKSAANFHKLWNEIIVDFPDKTPEDNIPGV